MSTNPERPPFIISTASLKETQGRYPNSTELLAFKRRVGAAAGLKGIGIHLMRVAPGQRTSWPHAEEKEEEFVYVLEGTVQAWVDGQVHRLGPGDFAAFVAGTGISHTFFNDGPDEVRLLSGGTADRDDNRIFYPLHPQREGDMKPENWWADAPRRPLGPHDGVPKAQRAVPSRPAPRVTLRRPLEGDVELLAALLREPDVARRWPGYDEARVRTEFLGTTDASAHTIEHEGEMVGLIQSSELGAPEYRHAGIDLFLGSAWWGQGLGPAAIAATVRRLFAVDGHHRIVVDPAADNARAIRAYAKVGFRRVGTLHQYERGSDGTFHDGVLMELLAEDFEAGD